MTIRLYHEEFRIYDIYGNNDDFDNNDLERLLEILKSYSSLIKYEEIKHDWSKCISVKSLENNRSLYDVLFLISVDFNFNVI